MTLITLPAGVRLHHGTDAPEPFLVPRGPAWFCRDQATAARRAGWGSIARGPRRVIELELRDDVSVIDTTTRSQWEALGLRLLGDPDPTTGQMTEAVVAAGLGGWFGKTEIMLVETGRLAHVDTASVPDDIIPYGR
jgi:hypothetical protein